MTVFGTPLDRIKNKALLHNDAYIGGRWLSARTRFAVDDPATGRTIAEVANLGADETRLAIDAAAKAWPAWRATSAKERGAILMRWFALVTENADDLARIMTAEQGKPVAEAKGEITYGASFLEWFGEEARRVYGETIPAADPDKRYLAIRQPIGVCAAITPWNFPIAMVTRKVAPALAAGCPVILKPAEATPLSALALAYLGEKAGIPAGVFSVVTADAERSIEVGHVLCESEVVRHLSFTGSTEVGRILARQCAPTIKKLGLELGGNAPFIVFDDADIEQAVEGAMVSKYRNAGQTCVCANRFYVQAGVYDRFVDALAKRSASIKVGNGFEEGVTQGPMIDKAGLQKVEDHVADAVGKGARIVIGGAVVEERFYQPTVLADVTPQMRCVSEETFGPVAPVLKFETESEVIALANDSPFGLASYLYSRDIGRIFRVAEAIESGMVGVNTGLISTPEVPFGGVKQSGLGREGSRHGIEDYVEIKYLCLAGISR